MCKAGSSSPAPVVSCGVAKLSLIVFLAFVLGACASKKETADTARPESLSVEQVVFTPIPAESLSTVIRASGGRTTLVNVWASWCEPCRDEFPGIVRLARAYDARGLKVIFVSADFTEALPEAKQFLARQGVDWATWYKTGGDEAFIDALDPKWTGALPGTFVYDAQGKLRDSWEGKADYAKLERTVRPLLSLPDTTSKETRS